MVTYHKAKQKQDLYIKNEMRGYNRDWCQHFHSCTDNAQEVNPVLIFFDETQLVESQSIMPHAPVYRNMSQLNDRETNKELSFYAAS